MTLTELAFIYGACGLCIGIVCLLVDHYHHPQSRKENMNVPKSTVVQDVVLPELVIATEDWLASAKEAGSMLRNNEDRAAIAFYKRHLKLALTQLAELRGVSEEALNHSDCQGECASESCPDYQLLMILERLPPLQSSPASAIKGGTK